MAESLGSFERLPLHTCQSLFHSAKKILVLLLEDNVQRAVQSWGQKGLCPRMISR